MTGAVAGSYRYLAMRLRFPSFLLLAGSLIPALVDSASAHYVNGTVYCDQNNDGAIDVPGDTPIPSVFVQATSLDALPGDVSMAGADGAGFYQIPLLPLTDHYRVELAAPPPPGTVVVPAGGSYVVPIVTGTAQDHVDGLNFLLQGCGGQTTSTTTSTSTTTTTTSTTTTTTLITGCDCAGVPFLVGRDARYNNDATIAGNAATNESGGRLRLGRGVTMPDGTSVTADIVLIGKGANISEVNANRLFTSPAVTVRNGTGPATLPVVTPFCTVPAITCGTQDVQVGVNETRTLAPGVYGRLRLLNGASVTLDPGDFTFCEIATGRNATITKLGGGTVSVAGSVFIGTASKLEPAPGGDPVLVYLTGQAIRLSQSASTTVAFVAPDARISFGRDAHLIGCFCTDRLKSDKHITLECPAP